MESIAKKQIDVAEAAPDWDMSWRDWIAILGVTLGAFMAILDIQITNASMREIQGSLGLDMSEGGWISTAYLIAEVSVIPLTAFFSKALGMRLYMLINTTIFLLASILCGFSWNLSSMVFFRVLQGLSGGVLIPMAFQAMLLFMPPQKKNLGIALFGMTITLAPTLGPSLGGWLTDSYGWRTSFFINIIPGLLMIAAIRYGMPIGRVNWNRLKTMDIGGAFFLTLGLASLTYILEEGARLDWFEDLHIKICFLLTVVSLPFFFLIQFHRKNPLLNLKLFNDKNFLISAFTTMIAAIALYGGIYALSFYLGQIQNYGATQIGQVMMWVGIPQFFIMPFLPYLMKKIDLRLLAFVGMLLFAYSNYLNTGLNMNYSGNEFRFSLIIRAIGQPLFMIPLSSMGMSRVLASEAGNASSIYNVMRNLGGSIGIALTGAFVIGRQNLHYVRHIEHINGYDLATVDRLLSIQYYLMSSGVDMFSAKAQALSLLMKLTQRESLIEAFSDIFMILTGILLVCAVSIIFLKKALVGSDKTAEFH